MQVSRATMMTLWVASACAADVDFRPVAELEFDARVEAIQVGRERTHYDAWQQLSAGMWSTTREPGDSPEWYGAPFDLGGLELSLSTHRAESYFLADDAGRRESSPAEDATEQLIVRAIDPQGPTDLAGFLWGSQVSVSHADEVIAAPLIFGGSLRYAANLRLHCGEPLVISATAPSLGLGPSGMSTVRWTMDMPDTTVITTPIECSAIPNKRVDAHRLFDGIVGTGDDRYHLVVLAYRARSYRRFNAEFGSLEDVAVTHEDLRIDIELRDPDSQMFAPDPIPGLSVTVRAGEKGFAPAVELRLEDAIYDARGHRYVINSRSPLHELIEHEDDT